MSNILDKIKLSGVTYDIVDATAIHSMDGYWTSGQTQDAITAATGALAESIAEQHYQTSGDVQNAISGKADTTAVTEAISEATSGKADTTAVTEAISEAVSGKANASDAISSIQPQVWTAQEAEANEMNLKLNKADGSYSLYTRFLAAGTGIVLTKNLYNGADIAIDTTVVAQKSDIPAVSGYADAVKYDTNTKYMKFYHGGTGGTEVFSFDASPFLIDGMVQNVEIKDVTISGESVTCLVISFNTDAGKQDINIPIADIFDASNYYTKDEVDAELSAKTDNSAFTAYTAATDTALGNKADTTAMTEAISEATSGKVDTNTYTAYTAATDTAIGNKADATALTAVNDALTAHTSNSDIHVTTSDKSTWSGKQDALVSGTNIKTVGGESLLGSGNIAFPAGLQVEVTGTTLVFG